MLMIDEKDPNFANIQELDEFISSTKFVKKCQGGQTVKLRLLGFTDAPIAVDLDVSQVLLLKGRENILSEVLLV